MSGKVYLVGAGPGDPELLTLKALRLLRTADAVLHDDLVAPEILKLVSAKAQVHNVGKRCGKKNISQEEIHFLMIALAQAGMQVVRLKGGDPLIFGRAGEEIEALRRAEVAYEIVPGITSALGAAAAPLRESIEIGVVASDLDAVIGGGQSRGDGSGRTGRRRRWTFQIGPTGECRA